MPISFCGSKLVTLIDVVMSQHENKPFWLPNIKENQFSSMLTLFRVQNCLQILYSQFCAFQNQITKR